MLSTYRLPVVDSMRSGAIAQLLAKLENTAAVYSPSLKAWQITSDTFNGAVTENQVLIAAPQMTANTAEFLSCLSS